MLKIHPDTGNSSLDAVLRRPLPIIAYVDAPEVTHSQYFSDDSPHSKKVIMKVLGLLPQDQACDSSYDAVPIGFLHTLKNVYTHAGVLLSLQGGLFIDNFRTYTPGSVPRSYYGALEDASFFPLKNSFFSIKKYKHEPIVELDDLVIPLYCGYRAYGHWILESLTSLWPISAQIRPKLLLLFNKRQPPSFFFQLCKSLHISQNDFIEPKTTMLLKNVLIASRSYMHSAYVTKTAKKLWSSLGEEYASAAGLHMPKKIYISRKNIQKRSLQNERECEQLFVERYGFTSITPEKLNITEQISLFANASHVAGPIGSAMHSVVFSLRPADLKVLFLLSQSFSPSSYTRLEAAFGRTPYLVYGMQGPLERNAHWTMDLSNLETAIQQWLDS